MRPPLRTVLLGLLGASPLACFDPGPSTRGLPCTESDGCGGLSCEYGVCGGPVRCEAGAGVGDYCFTFDARELDVGAGIDALAVAPVDIDALPDIVVGNGDAQTIALLRNVGGGDFASAIHSQPLELAIDELAIGAVDGAGWADVVATSGGTTLATIPILPGASSVGEIGAPLVVSTALVDAARPQIGHFVDDGDALPDVAALVTNGFDVFPQLAPSTFDDRKHTEVAGSADLHKPGLDANPVFVASSSGNSVVAHTRVAGGMFVAQTTIDVGPGPSLFVLDDLDNDANPDVLMMGDAGQLWLTTGRDPAFVNPRDPVAVYDLGWQATTLVARNLDDDREPELVVSGTAPNGRRDVYLFDNDGEGKPVYGGSLGIDDASSVVVTDLDLDGAAEIVVASESTGKIRVARRAVAPPPPGTDDTSTSAESTGPIDPTVASSQTDPSMTGDPTNDATNDPTNDPTVPDTDTGVVPCFDYEITIGWHCYVQYEFPTVDYVVDLRADTFGLQKSLFYLTYGGLVHEIPGVVGSFDPMVDMFLFAIGGSIPTGLDTGMLDFPTKDEGAVLPSPTIVATHDLGFTTYTPLQQVAEQNWWVGPTTAPVVARMVRRESGPATTAVAVAAADNLVHIVEPAMVTEGTSSTFATPAPATDIDVLFDELLDPAIAVSSGGPLGLYLKFQGFDGQPLGDILPDSASSFTVGLIGPEQTGLIATTGGGFFAVYGFVDEVPVPVYSEVVPIVSDLQLGDFDGSAGSEILALIDDGKGNRYLRIWNWVLGDTGWTMAPYADYYAPYVSAFTTADLGGITSEILVASYTDEVGGGPKITQLQASF